MSQSIKVNTSCEIEQEHVPVHTVKLGFIIKLFIVGIFFLLFFIAYSYFITNLTKTNLISKNETTLKGELSSLFLDMKEIENPFHLLPLVHLKKLLQIQTKAHLIKKIYDENVVVKQMKIKFEPIFTWIENEMQKLFSNPFYLKLTKVETFSSSPIITEQ